MTVTANDKTDGNKSATTSSRRRSVLVFVPLVVFLGLAALFLIRLGAGDVSRIPSALIGHPAPATVLPGVAGLERNGKPVPGLEADSFKGAVTVLNVWASWCVPCRDEAPLLLTVARDPRVRIVGINYKDSPENARRFLARYGNPYAANGADLNGRASIEWGVYGVPETYVVDGKGIIRLKFVGPLDDRVLKVQLVPAIKAAQADR